MALQLMLYSLDYICTFESYACYVPSLQQLPVRLDTFGNMRAITSFGRHSWSEETSLSDLENKAEQT
jgi:hypothetical protein